MTTKDHELLTQNLRVVVDGGSDVTVRFYDRLFARHPQLRELFGPNSAAVQSDMLIETLIGAVDDLEDLPWLESNMQLLGAKHCEAGITHEMYDWWVECVIETLAGLSGSDWSPRLEQLWRRQIESLCALMRSPPAAAPS